MSANLQPAAELASDPSRCPLCGGDNRCAMAAEQATGTAQPECWCVSATFSPALLVRLPAGAKNAACICARCVAAQAIEGSA